MGSAHHFATAHDVDATTCGERFEATTAERVDGFVSRRVIHCGAQTGGRPLAVFYFHLPLEGNSEVEGKVQAVGREIAIGLHIERRHERGHPKEVARQIAAREFGFPLAAETLLVAVGSHGEVAEFDMADRRTGAPDLEDEVAQFEIYFPVVLREINGGGDRSGGSCFSTQIHHEVVSVGVGLRAGTQPQQGRENK